MSISYNLADVPIKAPLIAALLLSVAAASAAADALGPKMRLTKVEVNAKTCLIEGYAHDAESDIRSIGRNVSRRTAEPYGLKYENVEAVDGKLDSRREAFSVRVRLPLELSSPRLRTHVVTLKAEDSSGNASYLRVDSYAGYDHGFHYLTYLSADALRAGKTSFDNFVIHHTAGVSRSALKRVRKKLRRLRKVAEKNFGFKVYDPQHLLLYGSSAEETATFGEYRGIIEQGVFTFPIDASIPSRLSSFHGTLDTWMPHELGDHSTRAYTPAENIRWLAEGVGERLKYLYLRRYYPKMAKARAVSRVSIHRDHSGRMRTVDMLDGKWGPAYYLCSAGLVADIAKRRGDKTFKKLFSRLNGYPKNALTGKRVREVLSDLLGEDVTPRVRGCSTEAAAKTLEELPEP